MKAAAPPRRGKGRSPWAPPSQEDVQRPPSPRVADGKGAMGGAGLPMASMGLLKVQGPRQVHSLHWLHFTSAPPQRQRAHKHEIEKRTSDAPERLFCYSLVSK